MPLPLHYLFVAGLGRRVIGPRDQVRAALVEVLKHIAAAAPDAQPVAMASGAAGSDQVFLEAAQSLGWPIRLVLPVPIYFFEQDFTSTKTVDGQTTTEVDEAGLANFRHLLALAVEVEVIPPSPARREAFTRCANTLVSEADVLVALWDHQPGKQGGTNESLLVASQLTPPVPTVILDALTGRPFADLPVPEISVLVARHHDRHVKGKILCDIDEAIEHSLKGNARRDFFSSSANQQEQILGDKLATEAAEFADTYKRKNKNAIRAHLFASLVGLLALVFVEDIARWCVSLFSEGKLAISFIQAVAIVGIIVGMLKLVGVYIAFILASSAKHEGHQNKWVKTRFLREICRSLRVTPDVAHHTGEPVDSFVPCSIWVLFSHLRRPILMLYASAGTGRSRASLRDAIWNYRDLRLINHSEYQDNEEDRARRRKRWHATASQQGLQGENIPSDQELKTKAFSQQDYQLKIEEKNNREYAAIERQYKMVIAMFFVLGGLVLMLSFAQFFCPPEMLPELIRHDGLLYKLAKFSTVFLPICSAALLVLPNLKDINRRRRVAPGVARTLKRLDAEAAEIEKVLTDLAAGKVTPVKERVTTPVWVGTAEEQRSLVEAWARSRFAAIAREAEHAILTEVIGFKTFVENAEVG